MFKFGKFGCMQVAEQVRIDSEPSVNVFANEILAEAALEPVGGSTTAVATPDALSRAAALLEENAAYDVVRAGFWRWRAAQLASV
jgi:hypothetical protein